MVSTKLLVPGAGDAHVHPRCAGDNNARFFLTRILPAPLADDTIQHAGMVLGVDGIAQAASRGLPAEQSGIGRQLQVTRNYSAVSGACMLTR
jgi:hypothetical protein